MYVIKGPVGAGGETFGTIMGTVPFENVAKIHTNIHYYIHSSYRIIEAEKEKRINFGYPFCLNTFSTISKTSSSKKHPKHIHCSACHFPYQS
jgi:hypothetical protein